MAEVLLVGQGRGVPWAPGVWAPFPMSDVGTAGSGTAVLCSAPQLRRLPGAGEYLLPMKESDPWPQSPRKGTSKTLDEEPAEGPPWALGPGFAPHLPGTVGNDPPASAGGFLGMKRACW